MRVGAIIPAAGSGQRMGGVRKAFLPVAGIPMLQHSVQAMLAHPAIELLAIALASDDIEQAPAWLKDQRIRLVAGGAERADSVRAALAVLPPELDAIVIHDAARPLITGHLIDRVLEEVKLGRSATVAIPSTDTLHEVDEQREIRLTPDRSRFWRAQTPQAFPRDVLELAFQTNHHASNSTDEAGLVSAGGWRVRIVPGETWNIKVTTQDDVARAEYAFHERPH